MQISPTFANRTDLSRSEKWRFTLEERMEKNVRVRAFYRTYFQLPSWGKEVFEVTWISLALLPLMIAAVCERMIQVVSDDGCAGRGKGGMMFFLTVLAVVTYIHPVGWVLLFLTLQFIVWLWFLNVMRDYDQDLRKELKSDKAT